MKKILSVLDTSTSANFSFNESMCESEEYGIIKYDQLGFFTFCFLENLVLLIATVLDRERLKRQGCVYICIVSNICMNIIMALLTTSLTLRNSFYPKFVEASTGEMTLMKGVQAALISSGVTVMFAICGNLFAIVFVRMDGGMLIVTKDGASLKRQEMWYKNTKRRVAIGLVVYAWILPLVLSLLAASFLNCLKECRCEMLKVVGPSCPRARPCSQLFEGLKMDYTLLASTVWFVQIVILFGFMFCVIYKQRNVGISKRKCLKTPRTSTINRTDETHNTDHDNQTIATKGNDCSKNRTISSHVVLTIGNKNKPTKRKLSPNITHSIIMVSLYVVCSTPAAIPSFIEPFFYGEMEPKTWHTISGVMIFLYAVISPILMLIYIPALVSALRAFLDKIKRTFCRFL